MHEGVSHTLRFQVLLRDRFTCQYCGAKAPQARVEVEHIVPPKQGGAATNPANLICSCRECNRGKGTKQLKDSNLTALTDFSIIEAQLHRIIATTTASLEMERHLQSLALELDRYWWEEIARQPEYQFSEPVLAVFRHLLRKVDIAALKECMALSYDDHRNPNLIRPFYRLAWRRIATDESE
jgi:hypothetical protein